MSETDKDGRIHIEDDDAMAAESSGRLRYMLGFSLLAAIVLLSIIWMTGALSQTDSEEVSAVSVQDEVPGDETSDTDGVVLDATPLSNDPDPQ